MDEIIRELRSSDLSLDDLGCILDMILADLRAAAATHDLGTTMASNNPPRAENNKAEDDGDPEVIDLVSPVKSQKDSNNWEEVDGDICIGKSLSMEDAVARRVKDAEANGDVIQCDN